MDILLPTWLNIARLRTDYLDNTGMTRALYTRLPETTGFGGDGLKLSLEFSPAGTSSTQSAMERAAIRTFLASLHGRQNRAYLWDPSYRGPRGSFPAVELISNNTFANGTTGWSVANGTLTVADRVGRVTAASAGEVDLFQSVALTQYAPHVLRSMIMDGAQTAGLTIGPSIQSGSESAIDYSANRGLRTAVLVAPSASAANQFPLVIATLTGFTAGAYAEIPWTSLSRCALVDNGANLLLRSDEFDNASWAKTRSSVSVNAATAPDGTATGDAVIEDGSTDTHFVSQAVTASSAAGDYAFCVAVKANGRNFCLLELNEGTGNTDLSQYFNLSTLAVGTNGTTGANWSNRRAFAVNLGDSWVMCCLVGRKTNAATALTPRIYIASADGTVSYTGAASGIRVWRAGLAQSSLPFNPNQTTSAASTGTSQTGNALHIKGGRTPSEGALAGALLKDDRFAVLTSRGWEMKIVTAPLDLDAAGLGYLQFSPPLKGIPADNAPIVLVNPMTRAIFAGDMVGWEDSPGILTNAAAEFEEA